MLRAERNTPGSEYGELIETHIKNGTIVPVEITCSLLEAAMNNFNEKAISEGGDQSSIGRFLIDGFPRNKDNLEGWQRQMSGKADVKFVLFFDCPREICVERCLKRGAAGSGRTDDNEESMIKRMNTYFNDTLPIIEYYNKLNLVRKIDGSKGPEEVFESIKPLFA